MIFFMTDWINKMSRASKRRKKLARLEARVARAKKTRYILPPPEDKDREVVGILKVSETKDNLPMQTDEETGLEVYNNRLYHVEVIGGEDEKTA